MNLPFIPNQTQKPETKQAVCDPWLHVAGRKYWIGFPVWAIVNLKRTSSSNLIFPQSVATFQREESVFLVWCMPGSRKENAAGAVPAGCDPNLHSQSPGHGISKAGMGVQTKETRCLDCRLPLEQLPREGGKEVGEKNIFPSKKHWKRKSQWSKLLTKCGVLWKSNTLGSSQSQWEISAGKV